MNLTRTMLLLLSVLLLVCSFAYAAHHTAEERGKTLFNDVKFAGGTSGKSCGSCHPGGKGLESTADKKEFHVMGTKLVTLEEVVNFCIVNGNKGKAIDASSDQMKDITAYIRSLKKPAAGGY